MLNEVFNKIDSMREYAVKLLSELIRIPAVNPSFGGEGEYEKAMFLLNELKDWGFDEIKVINAPDSRVAKGIRPNILAIIKGELDQKLWILTHLDIVPPGDLSAWTITDPFNPRIIDGKIYGRGAEDNGQSMVASLISAKAILEKRIKPKRTLVLAFVSDEEAGSQYGIDYIIKNHGELFNPRDVALVPDAGVNDGSFIEIAEKSILWLKLRIKGIQVHASTPHKGLNAHRLSAEYLLLLDKLIREKYGKINSVFEPPYTTCEPTMVRNSSGSPNIIPGEHEFTLDCRVLPEYKLDELIRDISLIFNALRDLYGRRFDSGPYSELALEIINRADAAHPTPLESPIVRSLVEALRSLRGLEPKVGGIGGGTVASFFRRMGIHSVVWSTVDETAHMPNEYCKISNLIEDAKVMAYLMLMTN